MRKLWLTVHLWLGLSTGVIFCLCGLTGSAIVFERQLDELLNSTLLRSRGEGQEHQSLARIIEAAQVAFPELKKVDRIAVPRDVGGVFEVRFITGDEPQNPESVEVFVDPYTGKVTGRRIRGSGIMTVVHRLHTTLLAGRTGETILGVTAILVQISLASGIYLWWPLWKAGFRAAWSIRRQKLTFDLHKVSGALSAPILLLIAFTGVYLALPGLVKPVVTVFSAETVLPKNVKSTLPQSPAPPIGPDRAAELAAETMPESTLMSVELPRKAEATYRVYVRQKGEVGQNRGVGRVWIDQYSGDVLATRDWKKFTFADTYFRIQLALHSGDAFGMIGRWLFCLAGITPSILFLTGYFIWQRKRRARYLASRPRNLGNQLVLQKEQVEPSATL